MLGAMVENTIRMAQRFVHWHGKGIGAVAAMAILLGVGLASPAFATIWTKFPNYKMSISDPNDTCVYGTGPDTRCATDNINGKAETWAEDDDFGEYWAKSYHEMNPANPGSPSDTFKMVTGGNQAVFRNYLTASLFINQDGAGKAEARYGGNVFKYNTSPQTWTLAYYFYAKKSTDGTHTISNVFVEYVKQVAAGTWTMGSLQESYISNSFGSYQEVNAQQGTWQWQSNQLYMRYPL